jgi:hypothetical protein
MTPLPTVANVARIQLGYAIGEDVTTESSIHVQYTGGTPSTAGLNAFAAAIAAAWNTDLTAQHMTDRILTSVTVTDLANPTSTAGVWAGSHAGSMLGQMPASTCVVVSFRIARRYRGGHPRAYIPMGNQISQFDAQKWSGTAITGFLSAWNAFIAAVLAFPGPPALSGQVSVSYYSGGTWIQHMPSGVWKFHPTLRGTPVVDPVVNTTIGARIGSQRRRLQGG